MISSDILIVERKGIDKKLIWYNFIDFIVKNKKNIIYLSLTMNDVRKITSKINVSPNSYFKANQLGFEFSGRDFQGNRIIGLLNEDYSTKDSVQQEIILKIPNFLSLEDACSIPYAYCLLYYALKIKTNITGKDKIIINTIYSDIRFAAIILIKIFKAEYSILLADKNEYDKLKEKGHQDILFIENNSVQENLKFINKFNFILSTR